MPALSREEDSAHGADKVKWGGTVKRSPGRGLAVGQTALATAWPWGARRGAGLFACPTAKGREERITVRRAPFRAVLDRATPIITFLAP